MVKAFEKSISCDSMSNKTVKNHRTPKSIREKIESEAYNDTIRGGGVTDYWDPQDVVDITSGHYWC